MVKVANKRSATRLNGDREEKVVSLTSILFFTYLSGLLITFNGLGGGERM